MASKTSLERDQIRNLTAPLHENWRRSIFVIAWMIFIAWFVFGDLPTADAQPAKKTATDTEKKIGGNNQAKKTVKRDEINPEESELPYVGFDSLSELETEEVKDPDETSEGKRELDELMKVAKKKYNEYHAVLRERAPIARKRDKLIGEMNVQIKTINDSQAQIEQRYDRLNAIQIDLDTANAAQKRVLVTEQNSLYAGNEQSKKAIQASQNQLTKLMPQLDGLNIELKPFDDRLHQIWVELNECRKQWIGIRVPHEKYARSEFEELKRVIDDWSKVDGLWPQVHLWAALCAFELGDYDTAWERVEKADDIRQKVYKSIAKWAQIEAMKGLIALKLPKYRGKSDDWIRWARINRDKKTDWETPFLIGRAMMQSKRKSSEAQAAFKQALEIKPKYVAIKFNLAILKTSGDKDVLDLPEGTKQLEEIWAKTGKRSWRISFALAKAYHAGGRIEEAEAQLEETKMRAPSSEHDQLKLAQK